jgi:DNA (cytosine-5)-methyltransferase 1
MFDGEGMKDIRRHRLFETNWDLTPKGRCDHSIWKEVKYPGGRSYVRHGDSSYPVRKTVEIGRWGIPLETQKEAMGVDWEITMRELSESIPPAYTEWIGYQLMEVLTDSLVAS